MAISPPRRESVAALISRRMAELVLSRKDLPERFGYRNRAKAFRAIDAALRGEALEPLIKQNLSVALQVDDETEKYAIDQTELEIQRSRHKKIKLDERDYAEKFRPHAFIIGERSIPTQITLAGIMGIWRIRRITIDDSFGEDTFLKQALDAVPKKLSDGQIPFFGKPVGVVINYSPYEAVEYALSGEIIRKFDKAHRIQGCAEIS